MHKLKNFFKFILAIVILCVIAYLFEERQFYWGIFIASLFVFSLFGKIKELESKLYTEARKTVGNITDIIDFNLHFGMAFPKILQDKTGYDDKTIGTIAKQIPSGIRCKIETYTQDFNEFKRAKIWTYNNEGKLDYFEHDDPETTNPEVDDYPIWDILFNDELTGIEIRGLRLDFSFHDYEFRLYLTGEKFENKDEKEHFIDFRKWEEKTKKEAILFRLKPYDFKSLEKYHAAHGTYFPKDPDYYLPTDQYRCYDSLYDKERKIGEDFYWTLRIFDFTKEKLPKLEHKEETKAN